jgi:hypothetical protein
MLRFTVLLLVVVAVAGGILWTRLANGPLPLAFLKGAIAENMSASLPGFTTRFDDVTLVLGDAGFELQIQNVRLTDDTDGTLVAVSPSAAISLSSSALWSGTIAAERVELVHPAMRLFYSREAGIALSFSQARKQREAEAQDTGVAVDPVPAPRPAERVRDGGRERRAGDADPGGTAKRSVFAPPPAGTGVIDLSRTLHRVVLSGRDASATGYLRSFGLRAATLLIDDPEQPAELRVRRVRLDLTPLAGGNRVQGLIDIAEATGGELRIDARPAADSATSSLVDVGIEIDGLNPGAMARKVAALRVFAPIDAAANFRTRLQVLPSGDVASANVDLAFGEGRLTPPGLGDVVVPLKEARFDIRYDRQRQRFDMGPSSISWAEHKIGFIGAVTPDRTSLDDGGARALYDRWSFTVTGTEGFLTGMPGASARAGVVRSGAAKLSATQLSATRKRYPIQTFRAAGHFDMVQNAYVLKQAKLAVDGGQIIASAAAGTRDRPNGSVQGTFHGFSRDVLLAAWPRGAGEVARSVLETYILDGKVAKGAFSFGAGPDGQGRTDGLSLAGQDVMFQVAKGLPALSVPSVEFNVSPAGRVSALAKEALVAGASRDGARLSDIAYVSAGETSGDGELAFKFDLAATELVELLNVPVVKNALTETSDGERVGPDVTSGRATGAIRVIFPAGDASRGDAAGQPVVTGDLDLKDAAFSSPLLPYPVSKANLALKLTERAVDVSGEVQVNGVPVRVALRRGLGADAAGDDATTLRLSGVLDRAGRRAFGFDLGGVIAGNTPVDLRIPGFPDAKSADVAVDLTDAQLEFSSLGFLKQPGRAAQLTFEVRPQSDGRVLLSGVRLRGEHLAVEGEATVGQDGELSAFKFPSFSLDLVSRVSLTGERRQPDAKVPPVWTVTASGPVLNGKGIFKGLTALGGGGPTPDPAATAREPGLELDASFETILGHGDVRLKQAEIRVSKRAGRVTSMTVRGNLSEGGEVTSGIETLNGQRQLVVRSSNAGALLRMIDFYDNMRKGDLRLQVALDGGGSDIRKGSLSITRFDLVGDPVVSEVILAAGDPGRPAIARGRGGSGRVIREVLPFDSLAASFSTGYNQLVIDDARANGQVIGGSLRGKADFGKGTINVGGTYSILQPLNRLPMIIPGLGELLAGPRGEGMLGLNYAVKGPLAQPEVVVHPLSAVVPGIFREFFTLTPQTSQVVPRSEPSAVGGEPATDQPNGASDSADDAPAIAGPAKIIGDWTATTRQNWSVDPFGER